MANFCNNCGSSKLTTVDQVFKDNTRHKRIECTKCLAFNGYEKQTNRIDKVIVKDYDLNDLHAHQNVPPHLADYLEDFLGQDKKLTVIAKIY